MEQTWRWFGPQDPVTLADVRQTGATGIVSALHQITSGESWTVEAVAERRALIEQAGLTWSVVESIPVHDDIKTRSGNFRRYIDNWIASLRACAAGGVTTICYNFMPVVDWTRTNLMWQVADGSFALRFDMVDFAAYDVFILERQGAEASYPEAILSAARVRVAAMSEADKDALERNIIAGLPGSDFTHDRAGMRKLLSAYDGIGPAELRANLVAFLQEVAPVAEEVGARLCIHPDDPPFSLFGLPRVVSTAEDARAVLAAADTPANGLTFCVGSYGARADNDLVAMVREFGPRIHFAHLRNVKREDDGSFFEDDHLAGSSDMIGVIGALLDEEARRRAEGRADAVIPMRPDHGHLMLDDVGKKTNPGYSCIGRLRGLAELRGAMMALQRVQGRA
ncbi:mannonate dehydratase [Chelatococcus sambhunathii]|uniref:Mannonate dehydratase n=1 Tax=Chelatococcus sambhunathii TaxID=363953 RepID=A0ABM9U340_9HYPH|nr:mannonate dehydratase [Chelatococcus sambhunathii]CUA85446.1 mannonate dehydratase [Chelatococcus sambhunathii]